jgi:hypothetical protein
VKLAKRVARINAHIADLDVTHNRFEQRNGGKANVERAGNVHRRLACFATDQDIRLGQQDAPFASSLSNQAVVWGAVQLSRAHGSQSATVVELRAASGVAA